MHCRKRKSHLGRLKNPSTSANVFWQFEKENDRRSGEPLLWGERCRIKHFPTRRYLAVIQDRGHYKVRLQHETAISLVKGLNVLTADNCEAKEEKNIYGSSWDLNPGPLSLDLKCVTSVSD